ncbi:hypothetical protein DSECCO2_384840 [anaerobic digester metagenome]
MHSDELQFKGASIVVEPETGAHVVHGHVVIAQGNIVLPDIQVHTEPGDVHELGVHHAQGGQLDAPDVEPYLGLREAGTADIDGHEAGVQSDGVDRQVDERSYPGPPADGAVDHGQVDVAEVDCGDDRGQDPAHFRSVNDDESVTGGGMGPHNASPDVGEHGVGYLDGADGIPGDDQGVVADDVE